MSQSDYIALAALLVSLLSAIYARWSVREAKLANDISLHVSKVAIYEEVVSFSDCFRGLLSVPTFDRLQQFKRNAVQRAEIYLSNETYLLLLEIYDFCVDSDIWLDIASGDEKGNGYVPSELEVRQEYKTVLNLLYPAIERIKKESKIVSA